MKIPLIKATAFQKVLELTVPVKGSREIWIKLGQKSFLTGKFNESGYFILYYTFKKNNNPESRTIGKPAGPAYKVLREWSENNDGGISYLPSQPQGYPGKSAIAHSDDIAAELDEGSTEQQWKKIGEFILISGLEPALIIHSGNKSYHLHFKGTEHFSIEKNIYLRQLLCIALRSDPMITSLQQPMRLAGFFRRETGKEQTLVQWREQRYSYDQFIEGLKTYFTKKKFLWCEEISDRRWRAYKKSLNVEVFSKPESDFIPKPRAISTNYEIQIDKALSFPLEICLTKNDNELIKGGIDHHRNNFGHKLACNLIATAERLHTLGYSYSGNSYNLFLEYCQKCPQENWNQREWEAIWRSAHRNNPQPSLSDDKLEARISYWQWQENSNKRKIN